MWKALLKITFLLSFVVMLSGCGYNSQYYSRTKDLNPDPNDHQCDKVIDRGTHTPRDLYDCFGQFDKEPKPKKASTLQQQIGGY